MRSVCQKETALRAVNPRGLKYCNGQIGIQVAALAIPITSLKAPRGGLRSPRISIRPICSRMRAVYHAIIHLFLAWVSTRQNFISKAFGISGNPLLTSSMGRKFL